MPLAIANFPLTISLFKNICEYPEASKNKLFKWDILRKNRINDKQSLGSRVMADFNTRDENYIQENGRRLIDVVLVSFLTWHELLFSINEF